MLISAGIIALFAIMFLGGHNDLNLSAIEKYVKKEVVDETRKNEIKVELKKVKELQKSYNKQTKANEKKLSQLISTYQATEEDFNKLFDELVAYENEVGEKFIPIRIKVQNLITTEEWDRILVSMQKDLKKDRKTQEKEFKKFKSKLEKGKTRILDHVDIGNYETAEKLLEDFNQSMIAFVEEILNMDPEEQKKRMIKIDGEVEFKSLIQDDIEEWLGLLQAVSDMNIELKTMVPEESWKSVSKEINKF